MIIRSVKINSHMCVEGREGTTNIKINHFYYLRIITKI